MKGVIKLKKIPGIDRVLSLFQSNIDDALAKVQELPPLTGLLIKDVELAVTVDNQISHGLGRPYQGFIVAGINAEAVIWTSATDNPKPNTIIFLKSSVAVTANIWVY